MDQKKLKAFRERLVVKKAEILVAYNKNKTYGKEADEEGSPQSDGAACCDRQIDGDNYGYGKGHD